MMKRPGMSSITERLNDKILHPISLQDGPATRALENECYQKPVCKHSMKSPLKNEPTHLPDAWAQGRDFQMREFAPIIRSMEDTIFFPAIEWCFDNDVTNSDVTEKAFITDYHYSRESFKDDKSVKKRKIFTDDSHPDESNRKENYQKGGYFFTKDI
jgi:hypothetical protein